MDRDPNLPRHHGELVDVSLGGSHGPRQRRAEGFDLVGGSGGLRGESNGEHDGNEQLRQHSSLQPIVRPRARLDCVTDVAPQTSRPDVSNAPLFTSSQQET